MMPWLRWVIAFLILCYGLLTYDLESLTWGIAGLTLFVIPLALQPTRYLLIRTYALWFGVFLIVQSLLSLKYGDNFITLPSRLNLTTEVTTHNIPGIQPGIHHVTTDELGFRTTPAVDYQHKRGYRIFAIGGSTTEDILLDDHATWPYLLQQQLNHSGTAVEMINTGVSGLRASNHLATLRRKEENWQQPELLTTTQENKRFINERHIVL